MEKITFTDIKLALKKMYNSRSAYFFTECKTCSTYFPDPQGLLIFDGLAITKSYTKPLIVGYEIKVSRSDFLSDNKWHLYLQYCNEFYFVVPRGLIKKEELPDGVGLLYYDHDKQAISRAVKKAQYREIDEPVGLYKYIIFSRLDEDRIPFYEDRAEYAKDYLEDKAIKHIIGGKLGTRMAMDLQDALERLQRLSHSEKYLNLWRQIEPLLQEYHIHPEWNENWIDDVRSLMNGSVDSTELKWLENQLTVALEQIKRLRNKGKV